MDEWTQSLTGEAHLAPSTIRNYQTDLRLFNVGSPAFSGQLNCRHFMLRRGG